MRRNPVAVIGLGNLMVQDDGAGVYVSSLLEDKCSGLPVDFIHAGTLGWSLIHQFEDRKKIILIDAGYCGAQPGEYRRFSREDVISIKSDSVYSLHGFDVMTFMDVANKLGLLDNREISIYCIQIAEKGLDTEISDNVKKGLPLLIDAVYDELIKVDDLYMQHEP